MITAPLTTPRRGSILFSKNHALMVQVYEVTDEEFFFTVLNGAWHGAVRDGEVRIRDGSYSGSNPDLGPSDFAQVLSVTLEEYGQWYMARVPGTDKLINRTVTSPQVITPVIDDEGDEEDRPDPVHEVTLRLTVLGQAESAQELENWVAGLSLENLAREMDQGELIGASQVIGSAEVPPEEVGARLDEVGNDGSFFEGLPWEGKTVPTHVRISEIRDQQGWNDGSMEQLAAAFIREAGLERAFLAHLEKQAAAENDHSNDLDIM